MTTLWYSFNIEYFHYSLIVLICENTRLPFLIWMHDDENIQLKLIKYYPSSFYVLWCFFPISFGMSICFVIWALSFHHDFPFLLSDSFMLSALNEQQQIQEQLSRNSKHSDSNMRWDKKRFTDLVMYVKHEIIKYY